MQEVKAPTLLRQLANRWRQGCQPYELAAIYTHVSSLRFLVLISVKRLSRPQDHSEAGRIR
jgi:hypothetical protein